MAKNKKLKLKQKQKQRQSQTVIVKVDNSRKTIRKGDSQPKQPRPPQPPIIINNQQPAYTPYVPSQPSLFPQPSKTATTTATTTATPNIDDAINAFSKKNDEKLNTLQEQLAGMNDNFKQASRELLERMNRKPTNSEPIPQASQPEEETPTDIPIREGRKSSSSAQAKPNKVIIIDDAPPPAPTILRQEDKLLVQSTPVKTVQNMKSFKIGARTVGADNDKALQDFPNGLLSTLNPSYNKLPDGLPIQAQSDKSSVFNRPKLIDNGKADPEENNIVKALTFKSPLPAIKKANEGDNIAEFLQNQMYAVEPETEKEQPIEIKKPDAEPEPPKNDLKNRFELMTRIEDATGQYKEAELNTCPYCGYTTDTKSNLFRHMRSVHTIQGNDTIARDDSGKKIKHRGNYVYQRKLKDGSTVYTFPSEDVEKAVANKQQLFNELDLKMTTEAKLSKAREAKAEKKNKATVSNRI